MGLTTGAGSNTMTWDLKDREESLSERRSIDYVMKMMIYPASQRAGDRLFHKWLWCKRAWNSSQK
jgi:hypothetical protein